jgi:hypothetical protein
MTTTSQRLLLVLLTSAIAAAIAATAIAQKREPKISPRFPKVTALAQSTLASNVVLLAQYRGLGRQV